MKLAIMGAGRMGREVAEAAAAVPDLDVVAVIDERVERARGLADEIGAVCATSLADVAASASAVYIGTPSHLHAQMCIDAAAEGLDILVDKPMCLTPEEAREVARSIEASGVTLMVGFSYRYRAEWLAAKRWLREGRVGAPIMVSDTVAEALAPTPEWYWESTLGGGVLQLQSHHCFDRLSWVLGTQVLVESATWNRSGRRAETAVAILARAEDVVVTISLAFSPHYAAPGAAIAVIQGTEGLIIIDSLARTTELRTATGTELFTDEDRNWLEVELRAFAHDPDGTAPGCDAGEAAVIQAHAAAAFCAGGMK